jgi:ribosomal protein L40E
VKDELRGKTVACPKCGKRLRVETNSDATGPPQSAHKLSSPIEDLFDEVGLSGTKTGRICTECESELSPEAVICIKCGFNMETGKRLKTKRDIVDRKKPFGAR